MDGGPMLRECQGEGNYGKERRWGVLRANWNGAARVRGKNAYVQGGGLFRKQERKGIRGLGKIRIAKLNIRSGRARGLEATLRALRKGNVDVGVLQETKMMDKIHAPKGRGVIRLGDRGREQALGGIYVV